MIEARTERALFGQEESDIGLAVGLKYPQTGKSIGRWPLQKIRGQNKSIHNAHHAIKDEAIK